MAVDDPRIDPDINNVARELTESAPPNELKGRVLARIADGDGDRSWPWAVRLAPVAALVAAVVLAVTMWPGGKGASESQIRTAPISSATGSAIAEIQTQREPDAPLIPGPGAARVQPPRSAFAPAARDFARPTTSELAPELLTIAAISVDAIAVPESAAIGPLEVAALSVTRLGIEPIGSQGDLQ